MTNKIKRIEKQKPKRTKEGKMKKGEKKHGELYTNVIF